MGSSLRSRHRRRSTVTLSAPRGHCTHTYIHTYETARGKFGPSPTVRIYIIHIRTPRRSPLPRSHPRRVPLPRSRPSVFRPGCPRRGRADNRSSPARNRYAAGALRLPRCAYADRTRSFTRVDGGKLLFGPSHYAREMAAHTRHSATRRTRPTRFN